MMGGAMHPRMVVGWMSVGWLVAGAMPAAEPILPGREGAPPEAAATNFPFRQTGPGRFTLGQVVLDQNRRTVTVPAKVNQTEGTIEYLLVTDTGKTHEGVLKTTAQPMHIHLAMLLLGIQAPQTNRFPEDLSLPPPGEPVRLEVRWKEQEREKRLPGEDLVVNKQTHRSLGRGDWYYNGSNIAEGGFVAQRDGSIVSTCIDPDALINNPRPGRENQDLFAVNTPKLPPREAALEVIIQLSVVKNPRR